MITFYTYIKELSCLDSARVTNEIVNILYMHSKSVFLFPPSLFPSLSCKQIRSLFRHFHAL